MATRDRWRIIRGSYVRYLRSMESEAAPKKEYYLAKYMEFVRPFLKLRESVSGRSSNNSRTYYTVEDVTRSNKKRRRQSISDEDSEEEDVEVDVERGTKQKPEADQDEATEQQILIEEELEGDLFYDNQSNGGGGAGLTYILRNGELVDSKRVVVAAAQPASQATVAPLQALPARSETAVSVQSVEEKDPDLLFFKSLLPQMTTWTKRQRNKFKVAVLNAMDEVEEG